MDINVSVITNAMNYIAEALNLIERKCYDVKTGYREQMSLYYEKYEKALYEALVKCGTPHNNELYYRFDYVQIEMYLYTISE